MRKQRAIDLFGSQSATAAAVKVSPQAVSDWPDPLPPRIQDRIIAAAWRNGIEIPRDLVEVAEAGTLPGEGLAQDPAPALAPSQPEQRAA